MSTAGVASIVPVTERYGLLARLWRRLRPTQAASATGVVQPDSQLDSTLCFLVRRGRIRGMTEAEISGVVAAAMYEHAMVHGGGEADLGVFGPRIYLRDARCFVAEEPHRTGVASEPRAGSPGCCP
ncbi:MAG: hypothetical protein HY906_22905 [Deltaproteobacteria bacterium]|nr:hypothetical protein [Deltaproteobacteria bacterium]